MLKLFLSVIILTLLSIPSYTASQEAIEMAPMQNRVSPLPNPLQESDELDDQPLMGAAPADTTKCRVVRHIPLLDCAVILANLSGLVGFSDPQNSLAVGSGVSFFTPILPAFDLYFKKEEPWRLRVADFVLSTIGVLLHVCAIEEKNEHKQLALMAVATTVFALKVITSLCKDCYKSRNAPVPL